MMKRRKWLISLVVLGVIMGFSVPKPKAGINGDVSLDSLAVRDTVASVSYTHLRAHET